VEKHEEIRHSGEINQKGGSGFMRTQQIRFPFTRSPFSPVNSGRTKDGLPSKSIIIHTLFRTPYLFTPARYLSSKSDSSGKHARPSGAWEKRQNKLLFSNVFTVVVRIAYRTNCHHDAKFPEKRYIH
jgi:hypothetical protein